MNKRTIIPYALILVSGGLIGYSIRGEQPQKSYSPTTEQCTTVCDAQVQEATRVAEETCDTKVNEAITYAANKLPNALTQFASGIDEIARDYSSSSLGYALSPQERTQNAAALTRAAFKLGEASMYLMDIRNAGSCKEGTHCESGPYKIIDYTHLEKLMAQK